SSRGGARPDCVIGGEYEGALVELAEAMAARPGRPLAELALPAGVATRTHPATPAPTQLDLPLPDRSHLPAFRHYAHLERDGEVVAAGYVEASRGCKHLC